MLDEFDWASEASLPLLLDVPCDDDVSDQCKSLGLNQDFPSVGSISQYCEKALLALKEKRNRDISRSKSARKKSIQKKDVVTSSLLATVLNTF